ncbi:kinase-like domain-containing protein [Phialemonium atrogriseum]|uniref:Altered inheritance of mitochondria protein 9, mitochondrial n=1 Tax=Phialemonium atrogriseum TaxID=1093897 RepID=A0AAJ0C8Q2_9PEZI|nr:kinase-like domain-containing protein [Phialemonium atrogriseum]KAK1772224.1 kinase-like domain-containing protein [Phialemonium atrogriseum]
MSRFLRRIRATGATTPKLNRQGNFDPYEYTSGCWMRDDAEQRQARRVEFNFPMLRQKAVQTCSGAKEDLRCVKVEGNFNRAFILYLDNGLVVVARIPFSVVGPTRLVTNSEVATLAYKNTSVPVPKVLGWSDDPCNPAGTEYIIMEHAPGHVSCVKNLALLVKQMHSLKFRAYGSIYFVDSLVDDSRRIGLTGKFCIGPHCDNRYWPCIPGEPRLYDRAPPNRGPWTTFNEFMRGLLDAGIARIPSETKTQTLPYRGTVGEHLELIARSRHVLEALAQNQQLQKVSESALFHPDLHKRNIFVDPADPTRITALIDWQAACIDPIFFSASETPDLCDYPESFEDVLDHFGIQNSEKMSICASRLGRLVSGAPRLHHARMLDKDLAQPFRYCYSSWRDSSTVFRDGLIKLSRRWGELGLAGSCPYQPSEEELAEHAKQLDDLEAAEKLKDFLESRAAALEQWLEVASEDMGETKAMQFWPFDL